MTVEHDLAGGCTCGSDTQTINHIVETALKKLKKKLTGNTLHAGSLLKHIAELLFKHSVGVFRLLLLTQLNAILRRLATLVLTMLARGEIAASKHFVFTENRFAKFAGDFGLGSCISCHFGSVIFCGPEKSEP